MRRCKCLRYKDLQYLRKDSCLWIYDPDDGFVSLGSVYPLIEFDKGKAHPICPYYLYIKDGLRISAAFLKQKELSDDKKVLIEKAVRYCKNQVDLPNIKYVEERHAMVLILYAEKYDIEVDESLFDKFFNFLQVRQKYLDISPCLIIPPIEHDERMECINEAWIEAFEQYLKETT